MKRKRQEEIEHVPKIIPKIRLAFEKEIEHVPKIIPKIRLASEKERLAAEKAEEERLAAEKAEEERLATEKVENLKQKHFKEIEDLKQKHFKEIEDLKQKHFKESLVKEKKILQIEVLHSEGSRTYGSGAPSALSSTEDTSWPNT